MTGEGSRSVVARDGTRRGKIICYPCATSNRRGDITRQFGPQAGAAKKTKPDWMQRNWGWVWLGIGTGLLIWTRGGWWFAGVASALAAGAYFLWVSPVRCNVELSTREGRCDKRGYGLLHSCRDDTHQDRKDHESAEWRLRVWTARSPKVERPPWTVRNRGFGRTFVGFAAALALLVSALIAWLLG